MRCIKHCFGMASPQRYEAAMRGAGFVDVRTVNRNPWYREVARGELQPYAYVRLDPSTLNKRGKTVAPELRAAASTKTKRGKAVKNSYANRYVSSRTG